MKKQITLLLLIPFSFLSSFLSPTNHLDAGKNSKIIERNFNLPLSLYSSVLVGHKTGENTAELTISKSAIQQNIIAITPQLNGLTANDQNSFIQTNAVTSYLLFNANDSTGKASTIALELVSSGANDLNYQPRSGRQIFICKSTGNCSSCEFIFEKVWIKGCKCNSQSSTDSSGASNCNLIGTISN